MKTILLLEYELPRDETRWNEYVRFAKEATKFWDERVTNNFIASYSNWADNMNHIIWLFYFDNTEQFSRLWNDATYHDWISRFTHTTDSTVMRLLRPGIQL